MIGWKIAELVDPSAGRHSVICPHARFRRFPGESRPEYMCLVKLETWGGTSRGYDTSEIRCSHAAVRGLFMLDGTPVQAGTYAKTLVSFADTEYRIGQYVRATVNDRTLDDQKLHWHPGIYMFSKMCDAVRFVLPTVIDNPWILHDKSDERWLRLLDYEGEL